MTDVRHLIAGVSEIYRNERLTVHEAIDEAVRRNQLACISGQVECTTPHADEKRPGLNLLRAVGGWVCPTCGATA